MSAQATAPDTGIPRAAPDLVDALLALSNAANVITHTHYRMPTERERLQLGDAVATILRMGKLHGLDGAPPMGRHQAEETFRSALRLARAAGVPRDLLVAIFNGEEQADDAGRKDLQ